jgi:predicted Zn-dependent protease
MFWDMAAWHMAWNASHAALYDESQPREALRIKAQREYFRMGEDFLLRGIKNNPEKPQLYEKLGLIYQTKFNDHLKASRAYDESARRPGAREYAIRFAAFELSHVPGYEREAYDRLIALYREGEKHHVRTLFTRIAALEEKLGIPPEQRIPQPRKDEP